MEESSAGRVKDFVVFIVITDPFLNDILTVQEADVFCPESNLHVMT